MPTATQPQQNASVNTGAPAQTVSDAELAVTSSPAGADIELDGNFVGSTPSTIGASPGNHLIVIKKSGFKPWERKLKISTGKVGITADLEAESAQGSAVTAAETKKEPDVSKQSSETVAPVVVPDLSKHGTEVTAPVVSPERSKHASEAAAPATLPETSKHRAEAVVPVVTEASTSTGPPISTGPVENTGTITVTSEPNGAAIYVDNSSVGIAPVTLRLKPGKHSIRGFKRGYQNWFQMVTVEAGQNLPLTVAMQK